jgi:hypothetical protein
MTSARNDTQSRCPRCLLSEDFRHKLAPTAYSSLLEDRLQVVLDRIWREVGGVPDLGGGETLQCRAGRSRGFAVCHCEAGEAGSGTTFIKCGAARPGPDAGARFERLLDACEELARVRGLDRIVAGVNVARHDAYRRLLERGYQTWFAGVIMQRPDKPGYCRPDAYVIDDLR